MENQHDLFDDSITHYGREFWNSLSVKALKNCTDEFIEFAQDCALGLATMRTVFDGSELTAVMQKVNPNVWPCPREELIGYYQNSVVINFEVTMARQRNYFTSASNIYLPLVGIAGHKVKPKRKGTHDKVTLFTSRYYGQTRIPIAVKIRHAIKELE